MVNKKKISLLLVFFLIIVVALANTAATTFPQPTSITSQMQNPVMFEDFDVVVYPNYDEEATLYPNPNYHDTQYWTQPCDPNNVVCLTGEEEAGRTFIRLRLDDDPNFTGVEYTNADLPGVPTGFSQGDESNLYCSENGEVTLTVPARWSEDYNRTGVGDTAIGSSGFGLWNNPFFWLQEPYFFPVDSVFFQWIDGIGFNTAVFKGTMNVAYRRVMVPESVDMSQWNLYRIQVKQLPSDFDQITFSVGNASNYQFKNVSSFTVPGIHLDCVSFEAWVDNQSFLLDGTTVRQNLPEGESQYMDIDSIDMK